MPSATNAPSREPISLVFIYETKNHMMTMWFFCSGYFFLRSSAGTASESIPVFPEDEFCDANHDRSWCNHFKKDSHCESPK